MLEHARARILLFEHARARSMLDFFILDATLENRVVLIQRPQNGLDTYTNTYLSHACILLM